MSDTPMTDAALIDNGELAGQFPEWVSANFSRKLELELAEANEKIRELDRLAKLLLDKDFSPTAVATQIVTLCARKEKK